MKQTLRKRLCAAALVLLSGAGLYAQPALMTPTPIAPFSQNLIIPPTLNGTLMSPGNYSYDLRAHDSTFTFSDGVDTFQVPTMSYNSMPVLGPTIIWNKGDSVHMNVMNETGMNTTLHWHGAHVPTWCDGGPHDTIMMDSTWRPYFKVMDDACTMWYHPHLHMETMIQVQLGLAGMIIINDPADPFVSQLPHTYGVDDFPLVLQDKRFIPGSPGQGLIYTCCSTGPTTLVNGVHAPVMQVPAQRVRFRILNGSSERAFNLGLSDTTSYNVIATDAGYTPAPVRQQSSLAQYNLMGGGERLEWEVDFTGRQGDTLYLTSFMQPIKDQGDIPGTIQGSPPCYGITSIDSTNYNLMRIIVGPPAGTPAPSMPAAFAPLNVPDTVASPANHRLKQLQFYNPTDVDMCGAPVPPFIIDNQNFILDSLNDIVYLNTNEIWSIRNTSGEAHPFHIHDIHFFILDVADVLPNGNSGPRMPPPAYMNGPKDVVFVRDSTVVRYLTRFTDFATSIDPDSTYMYHCHILAHEDGGMMHQFVVTDSSSIYIGMHELPKAAFAWDLFPNPSEGSVNLRGECSEASIVRVYSSIGQLVRETRLLPFKGTREIDMSNLPAGLWHIEWVRPDGRDARKLITR